MSAISKDAPNVNNTLDGVRRYHSKIRVVIHSHRNSQAFDFSQDTFKCSLSKTVKGTGRATLSIVPTRNLLNLLGPDDYVNIYFNVGDGQGWVRTFFGLIDKIEESYSVGGDGKPTTYYNLVCTDFVKVFSKTNIYHNPQLALRRDFTDTDIGAVNVGGTAIMAKGVRAHGTPDSMVRNVITTLLGFGSQFTVPRSYPKPSDTTLRARRGQRVSSIMRTMQNIARPQEYFDLKDKIEHEAVQSSRDLLTLGSVEAIMSSMVNDLKISQSAVNTQRGSIQRLLQSRQRNLQEYDSGGLKDFIYANRFANALGIPADLGSVTAERDQEYSAVLRTALADSDKSFIDYLDITTLVERESMDGYYTGTAIWEKDNINLFNIVMQYSNEVVNECFFDLRPLGKRDGNGRLLTDYSTELDDIEGNAPDPENSPQAICYVPSLVMREYPFGVVKSIVADSVDISPTDQPEPLEGVPVGDIFSTGVNSGGRHILTDVPNINIEDRALAGNNITVPNYGTKILDVAVISQEEIISSSIGRSDVDHVNLLELWYEASDVNPRWEMQALLPIVTPGHIKMHGLRQKRYSTRYASFDGRVARHFNSSQNLETPEGSSNKAEESPNTPELSLDVVEADSGVVSSTPSEEAEALANSGSNDTAQEDVAANSTQREVETPSADPIPSDSIVWPVGRADGKVEWRANGQATSTSHFITYYGFRRSFLGPSSTKYYSRATPYRFQGSYTDAQKARIPNFDSLYFKPDTRWRIHAGWDFGAPEGTPVYATMSGDVVVVALPGVIGDLGNVVYIKHSSNEYTVYAHLKDFHPRVGPPPSSRVGSISLAECSTPDVHEHGRRGSVRVNAGDIIGYVGKTMGLRPNGRPRFAANPHLHFQYQKARRQGTLPSFAGNTPSGVSTSPPTFTASTGVWNFLNNQGTINVVRDPGELLGNQGILYLTQDNTGPTPTTVVYEIPPDKAGTRFIVPQDHLAPLPPDDTDYEENVDELDDDAPDNPTTAQQEETVEAAAETTTEVQSELQVQPSGENIHEAVTRAAVQYQIARWALLQDHWYQHNLEYLAGSMQIRPAPEIRVGYRLDIAERDLSFYVEGVNHEWNYPNKMGTALTVTRGQPNNPHPVYVHPASEGFDITVAQRRIDGSRLSKYFVAPDPVSLRRANVIRSSHALSSQGPDVVTPNENTIDLPRNLTNERTSATDAVYSTPAVPGSVVNSLDNLDNLSTEELITPSFGGLENLNSQGFVQVEPPTEE